MSSILVFILILSLLVLIHEFGHFIVAKWQGIKVEEFGLGIPPRVIGKRIGETIYSLNLLPFGGFVHLKGEDSHEYSQEALQDPRNFISKKPHQRILVLIAGIFMNIVFGVFLFYVFMFINGFKTMQMPLIFDYQFPLGDVVKTDTVIFGFSEDTPLQEKAELGQAVTQIGNIPVFTIEDVREAVETVTEEDPEAEIVVKIKELRSSNETREVLTTPITNEEGKPRLGVYLGTSAQVFYQKPTQKIFSGFMHTYNVFTYTTDTFGNLISLSFKEKSAEPISETVSGPIGIYSIVDNIMDYSEGKVFLNLLDLTALISISLALINFLPLPALDGGRIFFVVIEFVRGKRVNPVVEAYIHKAGILVLMTLLVLVSIRDVFRLF